MKILYATLLLAAVCISSCRSKNKDAVAETESYEKAKERLAENEKKNPVHFLSVVSKDKHNLIGQTVIKGDITNHAKICTYKDVQLELAFFSKTGVLLEKDKETIYETIAPGQAAHFKTKYFAPKETDSVAIKILKAAVN